MEDYSESPLATREKRDRLARRPLIVLAADTPKPSKPYKNSKDQDEVDEGPRRRSARKSPRAFTSPPSNDYCTSSPITGQSLSMPTPPQVSMIDTKSPLTSSGPKKLSNSMKNSSKSYRANQENSEESDSSSEDDDDDITPVSTKTRSIRGGLTDRSGNTIVQKISFEAAKKRFDESSNKSRSYQYDSDKSSWNCLSFIYGILFVIMIVLAIVAIKINNIEEGNTVQVTGKGESFKRFSRDLQKIKQDFPSQKPKLWSALSGTLRRNFHGKSVQPLCFLFTYNETAQRTSDCLIEAIGSTLFYALNEGGQLEASVPKIASGNFASKTEDEAKGLLFETLDKTLSQEKVVVLENIDQLQAQAAMALHGICDEGFLPNEAVKPVLVMTLTDRKLSSDITGSLESDFERSANLIRNLWEENLGTDKVHPLISRIASVAIKILPENDPICPYTN